MDFTTFKKTANVLYPYFSPSKGNIYRIATYITGIIIVPIANLMLPKLFGSNNSEEVNQFDIKSTLASVAALGILTGAQQGMATFIITSTTQSMRDHHLKMLLDKSNFLIQGNTSKLSSLQYVTVGVGVRDFVSCAIPIYFSLPMYIFSAIGLIFNTSTETYTTSLVTLGFVLCGTTALYLSNKFYYHYMVDNQKIENQMVSKVNFIEGNRTAITLLDAKELEHAKMMILLSKIDDNTLKLSFSNFFNFVIISIFTSVASQFLGGYYKDDVFKNINDANASVLNVMLLSLMSNIQNIIWILTANYAYVKLNLEQLEEYVLSHNISQESNVHISFEGQNLMIAELSVYKDSTSNILTRILSNSTIELPSNKIYLLSAESGRGKTLVLKSIFGKWNNSDGIIKFPIWAQNNIYFIPQSFFVPEGSILSILLYPLTVQEFLASYSRASLQLEIIEDGEGDIVESSLEVDTPGLSLLSDTRRGTMSPTRLVDIIKHLLVKSKLAPSVISNHEIEIEGINWSERLSGGEKQKLSILRAMLHKAKFILMDEATSAMDHLNKQIMYALLREYLNSCSEYLLIFTDHSPPEDFQDQVLTISGQNLINTIYTLE